MHPDIDQTAHQMGRMPEPMGGVVDYEAGVQPDPEMLERLYDANETI